MSDIDRRIQLEFLITEREAMIAENEFRKELGQAQAYSEDCFLILAEKINKLLRHTGVTGKARKS